MKYFRSGPRILTLAVAATFAFGLSGCVLSVTGAPRIVADTSAILTGVVKSSQADTVTYWFNYGTTPDYGSTTTTQTAFGTTTLSELVDGLTAGTTYHYQLCSDVPDHLPPACGADHVVTTTTGHDSVHGEGTYSYDQLCEDGFCTYYDSFSIVAAVDPNSSAIEGDLTVEGLAPGPPASPTDDIRYTGVGFIKCLRVSGNIAVVGYSGMILTDEGSFTGEHGLVIEDNGATGDRYLQTYWSPTSACPTPSASLFNSGTPHGGDFVVHDG